MALDKVKIGVLDGASTGVKSDRHTIPSVTTSERDAGSFSAAVGDIIYNSSLGNLQQYTATGWASVAAPPTISNLTYPTESGAVLTALDASGSSDSAQTLIINGSNFTSSVTVEIQVSGSYVAFASSTSVNGARTQVTCTGVTKRAAADGYTLKVTNSTGLDATTTVNFSADPSFSTAAALGTVFTSLTLNKSIAYTGTAVLQGATTKPTWMTVTGNAPSGSDANGAGATAFLATGTPATLGGTIAAPASGNTQTHTFSIIVRDAENQTFNRDFNLIVSSLPTGGTIDTSVSGYRIHKFTSVGTASFQVFSATVAEILVVAGGGGGGGQSGAGGGAGGLRIGTITIPTNTYTITVGGGGTAGTSPASGGTGGVGGDSSIGTLIVSKGGGGGGGYNVDGADGGSGGGGASGSSGASNGGSTLALNPSQVTGETYNYQGFDGGDSKYANGNSYSHAGGGGASAAGTTPAAASSAGGAGGAGRASSITGSSVTYAGGGGGASFNSPSPGVVGGAGGAGGGGAGSSSDGSSGTAGTANTGGGGGGGVNAVGAVGGSGIVIIRYAV